MRVIEYFTAERREHWLSKIGESDWSAGQFLHHLLKDGQFHQFTDERARLLLLVDGDDLISFCTLSDEDDIEATGLKPWVGFVYTFPKHRGRRHVGRLIDHAAALAQADGFPNLYVCTDQEGIYDKYGFQHLAAMKDRRGGDALVYVRQLHEGV